MAWLGCESGASDAATLLKVSQRTVDGWVSAGPPMRFPTERFPFVDKTLPGAQDIAA